ncbi:hypothetical protein ACMHYJ_00200 [Castellaniella hirudinis]
MRKPVTPKKKGIVVEPLNWVSPEMREEQAKQKRDNAAARGETSSEKED